ncbi:DUF4395 domain-containing protein [Kitasatospora sp. GP82]|uniref:DUF4395 domain-containing protein n=1 Tax=Kitasatospora sp. GP82 TaxID=3035089 RepID=UPI00247663A4|nr:DUF4395 domain-containing protein [Kitasatospora sp. GP82]MDH6128221.1 hypothetical protein [Kitasatospora sp. GP82]
MQIDPRGPRFAAALTSLVLALVLITGSGALLAVQAAVFAIGSLAGLRYSPYSWLYRVLVRPRLGPPGELEDARPPRFAQAVGLVFATVGTIGYLTGLDWLGLTATALALGAAFLNAAYSYCLGCEMYLLVTQGRAALGATQR